MAALGRVLSRLGFVGVLVAASGLASAGYYSVSYSGGYVAIVGPLGTHWGYAYTNSYWAYTNWYGGAGESTEPPPPPGQGQAMPGIGSVTCSGQITVTFDWVPAFSGELPPKSAVLKKYSQASYSGESGSCANGLGHQAVGSSQSKTSQGTVYEIVTDPGEQFVEHITPGAFAEKVDSEGGPLSATASTFVTFILTPVDIVVAGSIESNGKDNMLPGQKASATVTAPGYTISDHLWGWDGPSPSGMYSDVVYGDYDEHETLGPYWESREYVWDMGSDEEVFNFAFDMAVELEINCTVDVYIGAALIGSAEAVAYVKVFEPYYFIGWNIGYSAYVTSASSASAIETDPAIYVEARVGTPALFSSALGYGTFSFGQLVDIFKRQWWYSLGILYWDTASSDGELMLDNSFPYPWPAGPWSADSTSEVEGETGSMSDSPDLELFSASHEFVIEMTLHTFLIWLPPAHPQGRGVEWAGLHKLVWGWDTAGYKNNGVWSGPHSPDVHLLESDDWTMFELVWEHVYHNVE